MSFFKILNDLPTPDLYAEYISLVANKVIPAVNDQLCINSTIDKPNDIFHGRGSLFYDWDNKVMIDQKIEVPLRAVPLKETDFTTICDQFKGTLFEDAYNHLRKKYTVGRVRIMRSKPKTCLTWHTDDTQRVHYPMKTQEGCMMIIEEEVKHLAQNTWWEINTFPLHTAINASTEDRYHLVAVIL
jgi:hypothetical protein